MSDPFQQGLAEALPAIKALKGNQRKAGASRASLEALRSASPRKSSMATGASAVPPASFKTLPALREAALVCTRCPHLVASRKGVVFGVGNPKADLMFVGEAPGADEDEQGEPFVGRAGQLLTKIILAMGFTRDDIYIANVLKCRPDMPAGESGNRKPKAKEMETCLPWLEQQISLIKPKAMVALGATAVEGLLGLTEPMGKLRGQWLDFHEIPVMVTYHPAYLLRNQSISEKRKVWEDMMLVLERLGRPISAKQKRFFTAAGE
ncbi:MAG: uracil-DNA glycosylase [Terrimicrobiaceae bacterium]